MVYKNLNEIKKEGESKLIISEGSIKGKITGLIIGSILIFLFYISTIIIANYEFINTSNNLLLTISNDVDVLFSFIIYFLILMLTVILIFSLPSLIIRKKILITSMEVKIRYYIFKIPIYSKKIRTSNIKVCLEREEESPKMTPTMKIIEKMYFELGSSKVYIRKFFEEDSYMKANYLNYLHDYGVYIDENLSRFLRANYSEDLTLDLSKLS